MGQDFAPASCEKNAACPQVEEIPLNLRDLDGRSGKTDGFHSRWKEFRTKHAKKQALLDRLENAGL